MLGNEEQRGIIPRAIQQIFDGSRKLGSQGWVFTMQVRRRARGPWGRAPFPCERTAGGAVPPLA